SPPAPEPVSHHVTVYA
nr:ML14=14 kda membranous layer protein {N-terminal} [Gecarcinus lateralis=Bermuda land crabs, exoskeleton, Peptide Partial, 16 aa] [Gecarcinus lateralis]